MRSSEETVATLNLAFMTLALPAAWSQGIRWVRCYVPLNRMSIEHMLNYKYGK